MSKAFKIVLMVCAIVLVLAVAGSLIYYYVFFRPGIERAEIGLQEEELELEKIKQSAEEEEKNIKQRGLAKCLDGAYQEYDRRMDEVYKTYVEAWNDECERLGLKPDSVLPGKTADGLDEKYQREVDRTDKAYEDDKDDCYKLWQD